MRFFFFCRQIQGVNRKFKCFIGAICRNSAIAAIYSNLQLAQTCSMTYDKGRSWLEPYPIIHTVLTELRPALLKMWELVTSSNHYCTMARRRFRRSGSSGSPYYCGPCGGIDMFYLYSSTVYGTNCQPYSNALFSFIFGLQTELLQ